MTIFELNIFGFTLAPTYYGLMYAISFIIGYYFLLKIIKLKKDDIDNIFVYIILGVVLGGRFGYVVFYNLDYYLTNFIDIFKIWEGGMSFHGGLIGVIISIFLFSKKYKKNFLEITDYLALVAPIGLFFGRIGNYINKELLGYPGYEGVFATYINNVGYFPSTLLEAFLEGILLFIIINYLYSRYKNKIKYGFISGFFLIFYGFSRIFVEVFFRQPDSHIGYILGFFTMGEILSLPMIILGFIMLYKNKNV